MSITAIKKSALLPYTSQQMFELVNHIEDYPRFLPWCRASHIHYRDDKEVEASLELSWSGVHKTFTTRNVLSPYKRIDITLVHGPFRHLEGIWNFTEMGDQECVVDLELEFELAGHFFDRLFEPVFHRIANSLVELFSARAAEVYGYRERN